MEDKNKKTKSLLDENCVKMTSDIVSRIIINDDEKKAFELSDLLRKSLNSNIEEFKDNKDVFSFYKGVIVKLKFVALPLLSESEIIDLLNKYFLWQFEIDYYNIVNKLKKKLLYIIVYEDRDKFKENLYRMLLENNLVITRETEKKTIQDWLKDYNSNLGLGVADKLKKTQYLIDLKRTKNLNEIDYERLKMLFGLYEFLKVSSLSSDGFDEEILIEDDNGLKIFSRGVFEPLGGGSVKAREISGPPKTQEEKKIEELEERLPQEEGVGRMAIEEGISDTQKIDELKIMANRYKDNSLQKRAIEEEIRKLETK